MADVFQTQSINLPPLNYFVFISHFLLISGFNSFLMSSAILVVNLVSTLTSSPVSVVMQEKYVVSVVEELSRVI